MTVSVGDRLPKATLLLKTGDRIEPVDLGSKLAGRRVVIVGVPGAFTPTCNGSHLPEMVRTKPDIDAAGIDEVIIISVNDPHVMAFWGEQTGATAAGITMLADPECSYTKAVGMRFDAPVVGLIARSLRHSMFVEDGIVKVLNVEVERGVCTLTGGENILNQIKAL